MGRKHAMAVALLLAGSAVSGTAAAIKTMRLGAAATAPARVPDAVIAARRARLDRFAASLARTRREHPPALPPLPHYAPVAIPAPAPSRAPTSASTSTSASSVRDVRPAAVVKTVQAPPVTTTSSSGVSSREDDDGTDDGGSGDD